MLLKGKVVVAVLAMCWMAMLHVSGPARADEKTDRHALEAIYAKVDQAIKNKDVKSIRAYMTEDFSLKRQDGKVLNRNESLDSIEQSLGQLGEIHSSTTTINDLKEVEGTAVADTTQVLKARIDGPDNKSHELVATAKSRDTWSQTEHGWMIKRSEDLGQSATMDGQPLP